MRTSVLHVLEAVEAGVSRHVANLVRHVDVDHTVVLPPERVGGLTDTAALEALHTAGARIVHTAMRRRPTDPRNGVAITCVRRVIRSSRPHVVHGHSAIGGAVARLAAAGTRSARVYTPHGVYPARSAHLMERLLGRLTDRLVAASESEAAMVRHLRLVPPERIVVIPNGIDVTATPQSDTDLRSEIGAPPTAPLVGSVGRLAGQKAPEVFIRACAGVAALFPEARFVLIGDGPLAEGVEREIAAQGLTGRFLWLRDRIDAETLTGQFDVFVLSSRYEAGAPYAAMEAMRTGVPVVLTDVVGNRDAVEPERSGLLVPPDDPGALASAIARLLCDPPLRRRLAAAARADLEARYDIRRWGAAITSLYESLH